MKYQILIIKFLISSFKIRGRIHFTWFVRRVEPELWASKAKTKKLYN